MKPDCLTSTQLNTEDQNFTAAEPTPNAGNAMEQLSTTTESGNSVPTTAIAKESTKNDIMAGLEDLFKGSPEVSSLPSHVQHPQKEVKKEDILSLFGKVDFYILF
jgi:hypothetical protein